MNEAIVWRKAIGKETWRPTKFKAAALFAANPTSDKSHIAKKVGVHVNTITRYWQDEEFHRHIRELARPDDSVLFALYWRNVLRDAQLAPSGDSSAAYRDAMKALAQHAQDTPDEGHIAALMDMDFDGG